MKWCYEGTICDDRVIRCDMDGGFRDGRQFGRGDLILPRLLQWNCLLLWSHKTTWLTPTCRDCEDLIRWQSRKTILSIFIYHRHNDCAKLTHNLSMKSGPSGGQMRDDRRASHDPARGGVVGGGALVARRPPYRPSADKRGDEPAPLISGNYP